MPLISEAYREQNAILHRRPRGYGGSGWRWYAIVYGLVVQYQLKSMLDYGCGESTLYRELNRCYPQLMAGIEYREYDPCIPEKNVKSALVVSDLVTCTDVLEHVEPKYLPNVLKHLHALTGTVAFFNIAQHAANKTLPDGRNTHLIQQKAPWWKERLREVYAEDEWDIEDLTSKRPEKDYNVVLVRR